jgi:hypothetical protein
MSHAPTGLRREEAEWLSLVRYQMMVARQQAQQPAPLNSLALNLMQDAVESMIGLVAEHLLVPVKNKSDFIQIFDAVAAEVKSEPPMSGFRQSAVAMNGARVNFKHNNNQAERSTIERHLNNAANLVEMLTETVFGTPLSEVSLLLFVRDAEARSHLAEAQKYWQNGEQAASMQNIRLAFDRLVRDFETRKSWHPGTSLFSTKPSFTPSLHEARRAGKEIEKAFEWLESIDGWVKLVALGVDMRRYAYFNAHTPRAMYMLVGPPRFSRREDDEAVTSEEAFGRCFQFVVDTALAFAQDDFDFDAWAARRAARRPVV